MPIVGQSSFILGQAKPAGATPTKLYTAPQPKQVFSSGGAILTGISFCDDGTGGVGSAFSISFRIGGAVDAGAQYVINGGTVAKNGWGMWPPTGPGAIPLGPGDEIWVSSTVGDVAFTAFGSENL